MAAQLAAEGRLSTVAGSELTRLELVVNIRFPGTRAHGIQVAAMAEALAATGLNVDVVVPRRYPYRDLDPWLHYGVARTFNVQRIASIDTIDMVPSRMQRLPFLMQSVTFGLRALARAAVERDAGILLRDHYTLEILVGGLRAADRRRLAVEVHDLPGAGERRRRLARAVSRVPAVITISDALRDDLVSEGIDPERILVARDGVHLERFCGLPQRDILREQLDLPRHAPLLAYAGQLYRWKGVDVLVEALGALRNAHLVIVGGDRQNRPRLEELASHHAPGRVHFRGPVPHVEVPRYLAAADAIALPNSGAEEISQRYTSPLKLFEAMASGRPIVASALPSLGEVLSDGVNARLVPPDDAPALARVLAEVLADPAGSEALATQALHDVQAFSWTRRGQAVAAFLRDKLAVAG